MIEVLIKSDSRYPVDRKRLRRRLVEELEKLKLGGNVEVSVAVVGSRKMKALNKKYRQLDKATNVLSFPLQNSETRSAGFVYPEDEMLYLGDIVICYPEARKQAGQYRMFVDEWLGELAAHGLEHLLGHHHD